MEGELRLSRPSLVCPHGTRCMEGLVPECPTLCAAFHVHVCDPAALEHLSCDPRRQIRWLRGEEFASGDAVHLIRVLPFFTHESFTLAGAAAFEG